MVRNVFLLSGLDVVANTYNSPFSGSGKFKYILYFKRNFVQFMFVHFSYAEIHAKVFITGFSFETERDQHFDQIDAFVWSHLCGNGGGVGVGATRKHSCVRAGKCIPNSGDRYNVTSTGAQLERGRQRFGITLLHALWLRSTLQVYAL